MKKIFEDSPPLNAVRRPRESHFQLWAYLLNKAGEAGARIGAPRPESPNHAAQGMIGANSEPGEAPWGEAPWGWSTGST